jgi:hypothetical protein
VRRIEAVYRIALGEETAQDAAREPEVPSAK